MRCDTCNGLGVLDAIEEMKFELDDVTQKVLVTEIRKEEVCSDCNGTGMLPQYSAEVPPQ